MRCTIRPKPKPGESLTSFVMRIAELNCLSFIDVWRHFNSAFQKVHMKDAIQLDLHYKRVINLKHLKNITGLTDQYLSTMSLSKLFEKFHGDLDISLQTREFMMGLFMTNTRRYCSKCLKEGNYYKLSWQISELTLCELHGVELTSTCNYCLKEQPYIWKGMVNVRCNYCNNSLTFEKTNEIISNDVSIEQNRIQQDWGFILNPEKPLIPILSDSNKLSIAVSLLYLNNKSNISNQGLQTYEYGKLSRFVRGKGEPYSLTLMLILKVIRSLQVSVEDYSKIIILEHERNRLKETDFQKKGVVLGPCLSPWCNSFGQNDLMTITNFTSPKLYINKTYYIDVRICLGCYLRYGNNKESGIWEECDQVINIGYEKIRPLINENKSLNSIQVHLKLTQYIVIRFLGYMCYHRLINFEALSRYVTYNKPNNLVSCFEKLSHMGKSVYHSARHTFGWSSIEYWYYHSTPEVQRYLYFDLKRDRGPNKQYRRADEVEQYCK